jgi:hypothetical protein
LKERWSSAPTQKSTVYRKRIIPEMLKAIKQLHLRMEGLIILTDGSRLEDERVDSTVV